MESSSPSYDLPGAIPTGFQDMPLARRRSKSLSSGEQDEAALSDFAALWGLLCCGTVLFSILEDHGIVDGLYLATVTLTTVGFGDIRPTTQASKIFMMLFSFAGIGVLAAVAGDDGFIVRMFRRRVRRALGDHEFLGACFLLVPTLCIGTIIFVHLEGFDWFDGLYFSVVAATTVGYGDLHVKSDSGKLLVVFYLLLSLGVAGFFTNVVGRRLRMLLHRAGEKEA